MRKSTTIRSLLLCGLAMLLSVSMLAGTTFAWFTDSVESGNNQIVAGNLDVELYNSIGKVEGKEVSATTPLFEEVTLWEPGAVVYENFTVANEGNLTLKYQFSVVIANAQGSKNLADVLKVAVVAGGIEETDRDALISSIAADKWMDFESFAKTGTLAVDGIDTYGIVIWWEPSDIDNDYNMNNNKGEALSVEIGVKLFATQAEAEMDSFGPDYDNGATIMNAPETVPGQAADMILHGSEESQVTVKVPAAVVAGLGDEVTALNVAASAPIVDTANKTVSFTTVELVDQNGKEVDLSDSTAKVTVTLPVGDAFANGDQVEVYHDGEFVTYATVADGYISYEVSHFCEVSVKAAEEVVLDNTIDSVKEFIAFANAVNAGNSYKGQTVVLGADLDLAGVTWTPIGTSDNPFKGTFDGNGKVIKNLSVLMAGQSNVGLFGYTTDGEIKNVTVENAKVAGRLNVGVIAGTPYTTKYTNITVKGHVEVDGMAYVGAVGGKNAYANWNNITVNVDETSYVNADSRENGKAYRTYVGGVVGFNGEGGHSFTNITSNINVFGSTIDVGGAFGIAHYGNKFENVTVTGNVTVYAAAEAADAEEMGGIAGVWHNESGQTVSFTNCTFTGELSANVEADLYNNTIVGAAYSKTGNGTLVIDGEAYVAVNTGDELKAALADNKNVIFVDNITMAATESNAYGKTGINVKNGQTIDGNGYTLKVTGAGGTWDSAISTTGGLIKNLTVAQGFRGIFINHNSTYSETVVLDNVTIQGPTYAINCDQGTKQNLVATNCTINGWTSFAATVGTATFTNCSFGKGAGYKTCVPYAETEFVGCSFVEGYEMYLAANVTFDGCTLAGVALTNDNLASMVLENIDNAIVK